MLLQLDMRGLALLVASFAFAALIPREAAAQSRERTSFWLERFPPVSDAVELSLSAGYTQGVGAFEREVDMPSLGRAGLGFEPGVSYRFDPRWSLGAVFQYTELAAKGSAEARGFSSGLVLTRHFAPARRVDPWLEIGPGYRALWEVRTPEPSLVSHGFQLARARFGVDIRFPDHIAIAPFVGFDISMFVWSDTSASSPVADPRFGAFMFAGVLGRSDFGM